MKKNLLYILPVVAMFASCGGGATVDNVALDAKVAAQVKNATEQLKTNCDALVATTSQMRADSVLAVKNAKANMPVAVAKPAVVPVAKTPTPVAKVPVKTPVKKEVVKVVKKVPAKPVPFPPNQGKKTQESGQNLGKKGTTVTEEGKTIVNEGVNLGKKK